MITFKTAEERHLFIGEVAHRVLREYLSVRDPAWEAALPVWAELHPKSIDTLVQDVEAILTGGKASYVVEPASDDVLRLAIQALGAMTKVTE
jgi:hypothetical protein